MSHKSQTELTADITAAKQLVTVGARYIHYKQMAYKVLHVALWEEDNTPCVIYQAEYGDHHIFIRPVYNWVEQVEVDGKLVPRFTKMGVQ